MQSIEKVEEILVASIATAKAFGCNLIARNWGITVKDGIWVLDGNTVCVLGAFLVGKKVFGNASLTLMKLLDIEYDDLKSLLSGFDGRASCKAYSPAYYDLGARLRKYL